MNIFEYAWTHIYTLTHTHARVVVTLVRRIIAMPYVPVCTCVHVYAMTQQEVYMQRDRGVCVCVCVV
jgi:hypothetical protein